jgi:integrase
MGRVGNKLSVKFCEKALEPGLYGDGNGLYLQVSAFKTKSWVFRFMIRSKARKMGLGDFDRVSLADARKKAQTAYGLVVDGIDPIVARDALKASQAAQQAKVITFKQCATLCIADRAKGWKSERQAEQWTSSLARYAYPVVGHLPVGEVDLALVLKIIKPIWNTKTETASRVRNRIENVLDWAKVHGHRSGDNPARWTGFIDQVLPAREQVSPVEHYPAMPYADLPKFMVKLRANVSVSARALELTILTAMRTGATIGATLPEFDLEKALWTIPGERLKGKKGTGRRDLVIPLVPRAVEFLKKVPNEGEFIFPGGKTGKGLSNAAMDQLLKGMGYPGSVATVHGFRSTFKDWATEQTDYPTDLVEYAYAHTVPDKTEAAYRRGDMLQKRRQLMTDWAHYCGSNANVR